MAKQTSEREDLLRDAVQMPVRGQVSIDGCEVFIGFRAGGEMSLYWDQDPVFQFNARNEIRRVFFDSKRYAAESGKLCLLWRQTQSTGHVDALKLIHLKMGDPQHVRILASLSDILVKLSSVLTKDDHWQVVGSSPQEFRERVAGVCDHLSQQIVIADKPGIR